MPPGHDQALRLFMASRDVPCPHCGYNLRDLARARCPECGGRVTLSLIQRSPFCKHRRPLLIAFAVLLALNGIGASYQWLTTSESRRAWNLAQQWFSPRVAVLEALRVEARREHAAAMFACSKVWSDENLERCEASALRLAEVEREKELTHLILRSTNSVSWFTIPGQKGQMFDQPHALFVLGAIVSAFALAIVMAWRRAARLAIVWVCIAVILTANDLLGLSLLLK